MYGEEGENFQLLVEVGSCYNTMFEADLRVREMFDSGGLLPKVNTSGFTRREYTRAGCDEPSHKVIMCRAEHYDKFWTITHNSFPNRTEIRKLPIRIKPKASCNAFEKANLVTVILPLLREDRKVIPNLICESLEDYVNLSYKGLPSCAESTSKNLPGRLKEEALDVIAGGNSRELIEVFKNYTKLLNDRGHPTEVLE